MSRSRRSIDVCNHLVEPSWSSDDECFDWRALFGDDRPIELEIGSGKGLFLAQASAARPDHGFFGIELSRKYARLSAERLAKLGVPNARVWSGDAREALARRVSDASLCAVHVYFPDPWWKKRHKKRRVFTAELLAHIERTLRPGGRLHVASDVEEYFQVIQDLIAASGRFQSRPAPGADEAGSGPSPLTNFERKYLVEGRPIHRAEYVLLNAPAPPFDRPDAPAANRFFTGT